MLELKVGDVLSLYFNSNNINNRIVEVRAIIDNEVVIIKSNNGNYELKDLSFYEMLFEGNSLKILNR